MTKLIVHHALLVDLADLAKLWEIPEDRLGLEVDGDEKLVPILIKAGEATKRANLREMLEIARERHPDASEFDPVVVVYQTKGGKKGPRLEISTVDDVLSNPKVDERRWWTFTDEYPNRMN